jgi:purine-binding chemotaxis protein CheW
MMNFDIDEEKDIYFNFVINKQNYVVPISIVEEIIRYQELTSIPETKEYIAGAINLRGKVIIVIDLRIKLGLETIEVHEKSCIVVLKLNNMLLGVLIDKVEEVVDIPKNNISPIMEDDKKNYVKNICKIKNNTLFLLNTNNIFFEDNPVKLY